MGKLDTALHKQIINWWNNNIFCNCLISKIYDIPQILKLNGYISISDMIRYYQKDNNFYNDMKKHGLNINKVQALDDELSIYIKHKEK